MISIKKSVKGLIIEMLRQKGSMTLKEIYSMVKSQRENIGEAHIRGVLNKDIKSEGGYFKRCGRATYSLSGFSQKNK